MQACSGSGARSDRCVARPQVLCLGLAAALTSVGASGWRGVLGDAANALLGAYVAGRENSAVVLRRLWAEPNSREVVKRALLAAREADPSTTSRALDVFQARPY